MTQIITIRLPEELYKKVETYCNETSRPMSNAIRFMIEQYLSAIWEDN